MALSRRHLLGVITATSTTGVAGCLGERRPVLAGDPETGCGASVEGERLAERIEIASGTGPPIADIDRYLAYEIETLRAESVAGGPPQDGIPSIDTPRFAPAEEAVLAPGDPVFGVARNGDIRAYPQCVLVYHEIVNDVLAGQSVAITYCPLTGTAQGFERGENEFGVSGQLVNSNLIMYDRGSDSWWPQIVARGIDGPHAGDTLEEFRVIWTTWDRWRTSYPETTILTENTGFIRRYGTDPYGQYNPLDGYYEGGGTMFRPLASDAQARLPEKAVVIGARTDTGAIAFRKSALLEADVMTGEIGGLPVVAVADPDLATGYVYANPAETAVEPDGDGYAVDNSLAPPDALPLERILAFDAMWFAWHGFYPTTAYVE